MRNIFPKRFGAATASLLALALVGCGETVPEGFATVDFQQPPRQLITIETRDSALTIYANANSGVLSPTEKRRLEAFVTEFGGSRPELIHAEVHGSGSVDRLERTVDELVIYGVERAKIKVFPGERATVSNRRGTEAIRIAATRAIAIAPNCPGWVDHKSAPADNRVAPNFGCSDVGNLAATIADPADLIKGRSTIYSDGERAVGAVELYRTDKVKTLSTSTTVSGISTVSSGGSQGQ